MHVLKGFDLDGPYLAAQDGDVAGAGVERSDGGGGAVQLVVELDVWVSFAEAGLPLDDERFDVIVAQRAVPPDTYRRLLRGGLR